MCERLYLTARHIVASIGVGDHVREYLERNFSGRLEGSPLQSLILCAVCYYTQKQSVIPYNPEAARVYCNWAVLGNLFEVILLSIVGIDGHLKDMSGLVFVRDCTSPKPARSTVPTEFSVSVGEESDVLNVAVWTPESLLNFIAYLISYSFENMNDQDTQNHFVRDQKSGAQEFLAEVEREVTTLHFDPVELEEIALKWLPFVRYATYLLSLEHLMESDPFGTDRE
jgi:hypothetical protein